MNDEQVRRDAIDAACEKWFDKVEVSEYTGVEVKHVYMAYQAAHQSRQAEIDHLKGELEASKKDSLTLAMRLYGEPEDSFAPETAEVMARKRIEIEKYMEGK